MSYSVFIFCALVTFVHCKSVIIGQVHPTFDVLMVHQQTMTAAAIPLFKRKQELYIQYPKIKGIAIRDVENGLAQPSITRGGLGFDYVNIKLKSKSGSGYKFVIEMYA